MPEKKVVVITGASSGIGRATAHEFARRGYMVVAASRNGDALDRVVEECRRCGSNALAVTADVTKEEDVNALARTAMAQSGRIDVWINNAAVTLFGCFEEVPTADIRRVVETNLFGYIYGARAAIPHFREQGEGVLVNISSMVALQGQPFTATYNATKAAERALGESLSQELSDEANIFVCTVLPAVIDTPLLRHGANYTGRGIIPSKPVHPPSRVAKVIADIAENPRKEIFIGSPGRWMLFARAVAPSRFYDKMVKRKVEREHFRDTVTDGSPGNLYEFATDDSVTGGWYEELYSERSGRRLNIAMLIAGASLALLSLLILRKSPQRS